MPGRIDDDRAEFRLVQDVQRKAPDTIGLGLAIFVEAVDLLTLPRHGETLHTRAGDTDARRGNHAAAKRPSRAEVNVHAGERCPRLQHHERLRRNIRGTVSERRFVRAYKGRAEEGDTIESVVAIAVGGGREPVVIGSLDFALPVRIAIRRILHIVPERNQHHLCARNRDTVAGNDASGDGGAWRFDGRILRDREPGREGRGRRTHIRVVDFVNRLTWHGQGWLAIHDRRRTIIRLGANQLGAKNHEKGHTEHYGSLRQTHR